MKALISRLLLGVLVAVGLAMASPPLAVADPCGTHDASADSSVGNGAFMVTGENYESQGCGGTEPVSGSGVQVHVTEPACELGSAVVCQ